MLEKSPSDVFFDDWGLSCLRRLGKSEGLRTVGFAFSMMLFIADCMENTLISPIRSDLWRAYKREVTLAEAGDKARWGLRPEGQSFFIFLYFWVSLHTECSSAAK